MKPEYRDFLRRGQTAGQRYALSIPREALRGMAGYRSGLQTGVSLDFSDYREYHPGDDLRMLDWRVYARSDKLTVKLFHEEVCPHADLIVDTTRSMDLDGTPKAEATLGLAAALAAAASGAHCSWQGWGLGERLMRFGRGGEPPSLWEGIELKAIDDPASMLLAESPGWRRRGIRILISDLMFPGEPDYLVRRLAAGAARLIVVRVLAREEQEPPRGRFRLQDVESGRQIDLFVDAAVQARYREALARHLEAWTAACRQVGAVLAHVTAEEVVGDWRLRSLEQAGVLEMGV